MSKLKAILKFEYFLYLSLGAVLYYLYRQDILVWNKIQRIDLRFATGAVILLLAGLSLQAMAWVTMLTKIEYKTSYKNAFISLFVSVFGKYIPGKVALLHGVTAYLHDYVQLPRKQTAIAFVQFNLVYIFTGFVLGIFALSALSDEIKQYYFVFVFGLVLAVWGYPIWMNWVLMLYNRIAKKNASFEAAAFRLSYVPVIWFLLSWLCIGVGFWLLLAGLTSTVYVTSIFAYPLATSLGNLAIFAPGGLGVREGLLTLVLRQQGLNLEEATTLATLSRLWFLTGEALLFLMALGWSRWSKTAPQTHQL